jgi:hypothetical protein
MGWFEALKKRWGVTNNSQIVLISVVFACTGFTVMYTKRYLSAQLGLNSWQARWSFSFLVILPLYQVILLGYGWLFGLFTFFWEFEKRFFKRIFRLRD